MRTRSGGARAVGSTRERMTAVGYTRRACEWADAREDTDPVGRAPRSFCIFGRWPPPPPRSVSPRVRLARGESVPAGRDGRETENGIRRPLVPCTRAGPGDFFHASRERLVRKSRFRRPRSDLSTVLPNTSLRGSSIFFLFFEFG